MSSYLKWDGTFCTIIFRFESVLTLWYVFSAASRKYLTWCKAMYFRSIHNNADSCRHAFKWCIKLHERKNLQVFLGACGTSAHLTLIALFDSLPRAVIDKINLTVWCQQRSPPKECYWCCTLQLNGHLWTWCVITAAYKRMGFRCGISQCHSALLQDVNSIFYFISVWINPEANWCFSMAMAGPKSLCVHSEWKHQIVASLNLPSLAS